MRPALLRRPRSMATGGKPNMDAFQNASPREQAIMLGTGFAGAGLRGVRPGPTLAPGGLPHASLDVAPAGSAAAGSGPAEAAKAGGAPGIAMDPAGAASG